MNFSDEILESSNKNNQKMGSFLITKIGNRHGNCRQKREKKRRQGQYNEKTPL